MSVFGRGSFEGGDFIASVLSPQIVYDLSRFLFDLANLTDAAVDPARADESELRYICGNGDLAH